MARRHTRTRNEAQSRPRVSGKHGIEAGVKMRYDIFPDCDLPHRHLLPVRSTLTFCSRCRAAG